MPLTFWNFSSVGYFLVLSSKSRYSVQLAQLTTLSVREVSAAGEGPAGVLPPVPQAVSAAPRPSAPAPPSRERRVSGDVREEWARACCARTTAAASADRR